MLWPRAACKAVTTPKARKLIGFGQPARFRRAELTADPHSLLVYEPNQFFLAHQDSEKDDAMVGTLVVTLPSPYAGGDLMVGHNEEWKAYRGPDTGLSLVAFYADCAARLRARLARPQRADGDWSIGLPAGCTCELCASLRKFLAGPDRVYEWPLAEQRRRHVHERIDHAELPVTHVTRRKGRPCTLVLTKTDALFTDEHNTRATATADLEWLTARWPVTEQPSS